MGEWVLIIFMCLAAVAAINTVFAKSTITAALSLLAVMFSLACIYAMIGAHFVAGLQLIVYAGAVMVLFIFIIMLLNPALAEMKPDLQNSKPTLILSLSFSVLVFGFIARGFFKFVPSHPLMEGPMTPDKVTALGGNVKVLSQSLLTDYFLPFELLSVVLLVAIVGALLLAKRHSEL